MKATLIAVLLLSALPAWGQGTVYFANRITGIVDAPVFYRSVPLRGGGATPETSWVAQLYQMSGTQGIALGDPIPFRNSDAGAGYWTGASRTLVGVPENGVATVKVVVWSTALSATYEGAKARSLGLWGESTPFEVTTGGGLNPPGNLTGLETFHAVFWPEPSVGALGGLGAAILLLGHRRKPRPPQDPHE